MYVLGYWHDPACLVARYPNPGTWETNGFPWCTCPHRRAPAYNCVSYPGDGPHYTPSPTGGCVWCGKTREQFRADAAADQARVIVELDRADGHPYPAGVN